MKKHDRVDVICAQGQAPAGAAIAQYRGQKLRVVPGDGLLATVKSGAFEGWMLMLRDNSRLSVRQVLEPAIWYAELGHPLLRASQRPSRGCPSFFARLPVSCDA